MEVKIGIADSPRELVINSVQTPAEVEAQVSSAFGGEGVLSLVDYKGRKFLIAASKVAYVEIGAPEGRRVGFTTQTA